MAMLRNVLDPDVQHHLHRRRDLLHRHHLRPLREGALLRDQPGR